MLPHSYFFSQSLTSGTGKLGAESQLLNISLYQLSQRQWSGKTKLSTEDKL